MRPGESAAAHCGERGAEGPPRSASWAAAGWAPLPAENEGLCLGPGKWGGKGVAAAGRSGARVPLEPRVIDSPGLMNHALA